MKTLTTHARLPIALAGILLVATLFAAGAFAGPGHDGTESRAYLHSYSLPSTGLALEGYCPVSYFTEGRALKGTPRFASTFNDVEYHFVSAEAKGMFDRSPDKYIPAYGGWCAFGMAIQDKFPVDPTNFKIVDGRLMLFLRNRNVDALAKWGQGDERTQVKRADAHWRKVSG